ncbi:hypothetical protein E1202_05680 [Saccharopolyspora karakumensis]|uniref:Uncharacterized protein n=1 Tax=Saccharopolyspora karakumensis TaxID=2530386 RepID=A0A4V2YY31_9PSEU|nr:hypothetical protein [Saccharopolyspora karakumensis]TDD91637.1 hypothetical protein E1202_05680 [Saccharopolyspora karakumensis]
MTAHEHIPEVLPAPPETGTEVAPLAGPPSTAPESVPGRRAQAFGIGAAAVVLIPLGFVVWGMRGLEPGAGIAGLVGIAVATAAWLADARTPRRWGGWALLAALSAAYVNLALAPIGLVALVAVIACPLLARVAHKRFTAAGFDLAEIDVEVGFEIYRHQSARLRIERDRAVLALKRMAGGGHVDQAIALSEVKLVQAGEIVGGDSWPLPGAMAVRLSEGPAVRVVAGKQQWVVNVEDPRLVSAILRRRQSAAWSQRTGPQDLGSWHALRKWATAQTTTFRNGTKSQSYRAFRPIVGFGSGVLGLMLLVMQIAGGGTAPSTWLATAAMLLIGGFFVVGWLRQRTRLGYAELQSLPPNSPSWGDPRPEVAPISGWRPWT